MNTDLVRLMQHYIAETCVGASTLRGQGAPGLISASRSFFKCIDLAALPRSTRAFQSWLERTTENLLATYPRKARPFGAARKALNLFLRSAAYNKVLCDHYRLSPVLPLLELPIDSFAAKHLRSLRRGLPKWNRLKRVTTEEHSSFQSAASSIALELDVNRVDLDVWFFRTEIAT